MRLIDADALIKQLLVDQLECPGCPEPEFLPELIEVLKQAQSVQSVADCISRQEAIDALDEIRHALWEIDIPSPTVPEYIEHHEQVQSVWKLLDKKQKELYAMPSAQPEQQWISCSERLPFDAGYYLTTTTYNEVFCDYWNLNEWNRTEQVIAWMYMPEPFMEDDK